MSRLCHPVVLILCSIALVIINILSYRHILYLEEQIQKSQKHSLTCRQKQLTTTKIIINNIIPLKSVIPIQKQDDFIKLQRYLYSLLPGRMQELKVDSNLQYSCPETYKGTIYEFPFTKGFVRENCTKSSIFNSTTIILTYPVFQRDRLHSVIQNALLLFHKIIIIIDIKAQKEMQNLHIYFPDNRVNTTFVHSRIGFTYGDALNNAISLVESPFILIAPWLGRLEANLDVERLINVQETTKAAIVGSAVKNIDSGEWEQGCYQTQLKLYILKYNAGYHSSQHECLVCHYIISPFIATRNFLLQHPFRKIDHGVFRDFFLQLKMENEKVLACPDVMFYTRKPIEIESNLVNFAKHWDIRKIIEPNNTILWYGFKAGLKHTRIIDFSLIANPGRPECGVSQSKAVSPDCRRNLLDAIIFILDQCKKYNITCELEEGTLLGVLKFNHILPWERDADITFLSREYYKIKALQGIFSKAGFKMIFVEEAACCINNKHYDGVIYVTAYGWNIEMYGKSEIMNRTEPYTVVKVGNHLMDVPENPGLYVRNRYGIEIYKHVEHWRTLKKKHGFVAYDSGMFLQCVSPTHHSCLDQFQVDGNIQFLEWL